MKRSSHTPRERMWSELFEDPPRRVLEYRHQFTMSRLLGSMMVVAIGYWLAMQTEYVGEGIAIVIAAIGAAIGMIARGPIGAICGAAFTWLAMGLLLFVFAVIAGGFVFVTS